MGRQRRREINVFSLSFLDLISGALGAVIILYVAVPKANPLQKELEKLKQQLASSLAGQGSEASELVRLRAQEAQAMAAIEENARLRAIPVPIPAPVQTSGVETDVGFKFKGKHIVFVVDTSKSMLEEDRMGQVKAGLKMLLTAMPGSYYLDVVQFPWGDRAPYRALSGGFRPLGAEARQDVFDFLYKLRPLGATPTRDALNYVFRTYRNMTDLVLLTDGEPSIHNSVLKDDIYDLLNHVRSLNAGTRVQISTIGVGEGVLHDKAGRPYQFVKLLAEQNGGFFVGF